MHRITITTNEQTHLTVLNTGEPETYSSCSAHSIVRMHRMDDC